MIFNGPSRQEFRDYEFSGWVLGCNYAYRDWPLTHCWAVDRMTVAHIRGELEGRTLPCEFWTKETSLELPQEWHHRPTPGIDSGTAAVAHALTLTSGPVIVIGSDGLLGGSHETAYQFPWHPGTPTEKAHRRHRETLEMLVRQNPHRIFLVWPHPSEQFKTISKSQAIELANKYRANEGL